FSHHRPVSAADAQAHAADPFRHPGRVQILCHRGDGQGVFAGIVQPADPLLAPCRRGFRPPQGGADGKAGALEHVKRFFEQHVLHLPQHMYGIVADLSDYPRFVPNCKAMEVRPDPAAAGADVRLARMTLYFGPVTQAYTSRVTLDPVAHTITAKAVDGPF